MNKQLQLVDILQNQAITTSRIVAEYFHKQHKNVLRDIDNLIAQIASEQQSSKLSRPPMFQKSTYKVDESMTPYPEYLMNRDGFTLLAMGFTGKKALQFKLAYIDAFNKMEAILSERKTLDWQQMRKQGKLTRKSETDVIKQLVDYAKEQGSEHAEKLYIIYSNLANKAAGIQSKTRDKAPTHILYRLDYFEDIILKQIRLSMDENKHYKQIYQDCKHRLQMLLDISLSSYKVA